jgi:hypothetical protein
MTRSIQSEVTHSVWEVMFDADLNMTKIFLNNHRVYPTERLSATLWKKFDEQYDLERELHEEKFDRYIEY